jgi:hypothetical protein
LALFAQAGREKAIRPIGVSAKRALIVGNGNYSHQPAIPQSLNDADDMDRTLRTLGFLTTVRKDLDLAGLNREIAAFVRTIQSNDLALVYYSGHGGMVEGENYILPVNYQVPALPREVEQRAFRMSYLKKDLEDSGARVRVMIFDACRNNSLVAAKSTGQAGLGAMRGNPEGTIIAYASDDGQPARYDPADRNSFYTKALKLELAVPGVGLKDALERTQLAVYLDTGKVQRPYLYGFLTGPVFLSGPQSNTPEPTPEARQPGKPPAIDAGQPATQEQAEPPRSKRIVFCYRFAIRYTPEWWSTNDAGEPPSNERLQFAMFDSKLKAILTGESVQKSIDELRDESTAALGGPAQVQIEEGPQPLKTSPPFYRMVLVKGASRYLYYLSTGEAGTMRAVVYGPANDAGWATLKPEHFLKGIAIVATENR